MGRGRGRGRGSGGKGARGGAWQDREVPYVYPGGPALPPAPANLVATAASDTAIDLAWEAGGDGAATFHVEHSADGATYAEIGTTAGDTTEYADTGLDAETEYTYRVRARNQAGYSAYCAADSATTEASGPAILFAEDFAAPLGERWATSGPGATVTPGAGPGGAAALVLSDGGYASLAAWDNTAPPDSRTFSIKVDCWYPDDGSLIQTPNMRIDGSQFMGLQVVEEPAYSLSLSTADWNDNRYSPEEPIPVRGAWHTHELVYLGALPDPELRWYIDDALVATAVDDSGTTRGAGYWPQSVWFGQATAKFANVSVADGLQGV